MRLAQLSSQSQNPGPSGADCRPLHSAAASYLHTDTWPHGQPYHRGAYVHIHPTGDRHGHADRYGHVTPTDTPSPTITPTISPTFTPTPVLGRMIGNVFVRAAPDPTIAHSGKVIRLGDIVVVVERREPWVHIRFPVDGPPTLEGWIPSRWVVAFP